MNLSTTWKNSCGQWEELARVLPQNISHVKWRDDDPLFVFDDDNVTKPETPTATLTPVQTCEEEDQVIPSVKSPLGKKPCFRESIAKRLLKTAPTRLEPSYDDAELVYSTIIGEHDPLD